MEVSVDYIACTFFDRSKEDVFAVLAVPGLAFSEGKGAHGYRACLYAEGVRVYYDGQLNMGVYVQVSGEGVRLLEASGGFEGVKAYIRRLAEAGGRLSRLDLAYDDREGIVDRSSLHAQAVARGYTSRWQGLREEVQYRDGEVSSFVLRFGQRTGQSQLVVYDKRLERLQAVGEDFGHWMRFELRFFDEKAVALGAWLIEQVDLSEAGGWLRGSIEFREAEGSTRIARAKISGWWQEFVSSAVKCVVNRTRPLRSLQQIADQFRKTWAPTLCMLTMAFCEGKRRGPWLDDLITDGWLRMGDRHLQLLRGALLPNVDQSVLLPE